MNPFQQMPWNRLCRATGIAPSKGVGESEAKPGGEPQSIQLSDSMRSMYCCFASSLLVPLSLFQASYLARPTMSLKPGFFSALSPVLPCL